MGRELKRVPLDFKWPIKKIWRGYLNPYNSSECKSCGGSGFNPATKKIDDAWHNWRYQLTDIETKALLEENRLVMLTHIPTSTGDWKEIEPKHIPTAEEVNEWYQVYPQGHDLINRWICVEARSKHLGIYGVCEHCDEGRIWQSVEIKKLHDDWGSVEPPIGEGYQLWSTTKSHPMTPVFATLEQLCGYCEKKSVSVSGYSTLTKEQWMELFNGEQKECASF